MAFSKFARMLKDIPKPTQAQRDEAALECKKIFDEFTRWFAGAEEANAHHEKAVDVLQEALSAASKHPSMTLEIKKLLIICNN